MDKKRKETIPRYFGIFIILAMLPQLVGFNGFAIDSIYKLLILVWLFIMTTELKTVGRVSYFTFVFIIFGVVGTIGTFAVNNTSIIEELYILLIGIILSIILVESTLKETTLRVVDIEVFYKIFVYFVLVAAIYNMIIHFNSLLHITSISVYSAENVCSFFDNKNTYGVFLIFAVLASTILRIISREKRWLIFSCVFLINEMMAMCRTAIVLSLLMIAISFLTDKRKRIRNIVVFFGLLIFITIILANNVAINEYVFNNLFGSTESVDARNSYVESLLPLVKGVHFWFGYGNQGAAELAVQYTGNVYYHNAYLKELMMGGAIKLGIQIFALATSFKYGLKCRKLQKTIGNLCLLSTIIYVIYVFVESVILFDTPVVAIMAVMFIISMPILFYKSLINERVTGGEKHGL